MSEHESLDDFLKTSPRGTGAAIAKRMRVHPVMVSQWAAGTKPVPEDRAPSLEWETGFRVRCETVCPNSHWVRVSHADWPHGKPLLDKAPVPTPEPAKAA